MVVNSKSSVDWLNLPPIFLNLASWVQLSKNDCQKRLRFEEYFVLRSKAKEELSQSVIKLIHYSFDGKQHSQAPPRRAGVLDFTLGRSCTLQLNEPYTPLSCAILFHGGYNPQQTMHRSLLITCYPSQFTAFSQK